jgi:ABC-type spermidine/putrescine transport system permease subunit II
MNWEAKDLCPRCGCMGLLIIIITVIISPYRNKTCNIEIYWSLRNGWASVMNSGVFLLIVLCGMVYNS